MTAKETSAGIAFLCDQYGVILDVMRDEIGMGDRLAPGQTLADVADKASDEKIKNFLNELVEEGAAFDWEINVPMRGRLITLQFGGSRADSQRYMVVAAQSQRAALKLYEDLLQISNEQTNALRESMAASNRLGRKLHEYESVYRDLTAVNNELMDLQRQLHKQNAELVRLNKEKNQFLGMAAHDLRSPLGAIQAFADLLLGEMRNTLTDDEQSEILQTIRDESRSMLSMVEDLLDITSIEAGTVHLNIKEVDVEALVQRNVQRNRMLAAAKQIDLGAEFEPNLPTLHADPGKLEQVLNNLISNAIKYSHHGTQVLVSVKSVEPVKSVGTSADEGPQSAILLSFQDQGMGIDPAEVDRLFRPFGKTSNRTTGGERSTGLGLTIVKRIVESHGGTVDVESERGRGSIFRVLLPLHQPQKASTELGSGR